MQLSQVLLFFVMCVEFSFSQNVSSAVVAACERLPQIPNTFISEEESSRSYSEGDIIDFTCEAGYVLSMRIAYVCTEGGWEKLRKGKCYLKPCELPDDTQNGYYEIIRGDEFVFGTTIKYICNDGYQMVSKTDTRTCLVDGWSNHVPACEPASCTPPDADTGLTVEGLPDNDEPILYNRFITLSCDTVGKYLKGSSSLVCGKNGTWKTPVPTCEDVTCASEELHPMLNVQGLPLNNESMKYKHRLNFQCDTKSVRIGASEIICLETGKWSAAFPTCTVGCEMPALPQNVGIRENRQKMFTNGTTLHFGCFGRNLYLNGPKVIQCLDGQWSDYVPTCGAPSGCGVPTLLENGDTKRAIKYTYGHNERVEYICQAYYKLRDQISHRTCQNGEWVGDIRCLKPCTVNEDDMRIRNIKFRYTYNTKLYSEHGDEMEFMCNKRSQVPVTEIGMRQQCLDGVISLPRCQ